MSRAVIGLLTDFGTSDHYVAAMKGVILGIAPDATLVDITHDIPPQDIAAAAVELAACCRDFPPGSIFLVVVDPGVGTSRRGIAARAGERFFVAPDNGVLALSIEAPGDAVVVELRERQYARLDVSSTFEGRDRFAPAAAWLARGTDIAAFGPPLVDYVRLAVKEPRVGEGIIVGEVLKIDRFGNVVTNISRRVLEALLARGAPVIRAGNRHVNRLVRTYGEVAHGEVCALIGSAGYLEVAANGGSAARLLDLARGTRVVVASSRDALEKAAHE